MNNDLHILRHSLGLADDGTGREYRNHYCANPGDTQLEALVAAGDMERAQQVSWLGDLVLYHVTPQGRKRARAGVTVKRKTKAQRRYLAWLESECGFPFKVWMTHPHFAEARRRC